MPEDVQHVRPGLPFHRLHNENVFCKATNVTVRFFPKAGWSPFRPGAFLIRADIYVSSSRIVLVETQRRACSSTVTQGDVFSISLSTVREQTVRLVNLGTQEDPDFRVEFTTEKSSLGGSAGRTLPPGCYVFFGARWDTLVGVYYLIIQSKFQLRFGSRVVKNADFKAPSMVETDLDAEGLSNCQVYVDMESREVKYVFRPLETEHRKAFVDPKTDEVYLTAVSHEETMEQIAPIAHVSRTELREMQNLVDTCFECVDRLLEATPRRTYSSENQSAAIRPRGPTPS